jgi:hypothetical protein
MKNLKVFCNLFLHKSKFAEHEIRHIHLSNILGTYDFNRFLNFDHQLSRKMGIRYPNNCFHFRIALILASF